MRFVAWRILRALIFAAIIAAAVIAISRISVSYTHLTLPTNREV